MGSLLGGSALLIGALAGWYAPMSKRTIAGIMAFGAGVLISALAFELMDEAWQRGGFAPVAGGFLGGATLYTVLNLLLAHHGARHRKRTGVEHRAQDKKQNPQNGMALALGALLDGIPESIVIGVSLLGGGAIGLVAVIAVFLSNIPEGLSSAAGMKAEGRSVGFVFLLWTGIALISGLSSLGGFVLFDGVAPGDGRRHDGARGVRGDARLCRLDRCSRLPRRLHAVEAERLRKTAPRTENALRHVLHPPPTADGPSPCQSRRGIATFRDNFEPPPIKLRDLAAPYLIPTPDRR